MNFDLKQGMRTKLHAQRAYALRTSDTDRNQNTYIPKGCIQTELYQRRFYSTGKAGATQVS